MIGDSGSLLHVVGDDDDGVVGLEGVMSSSISGGNGSSAEAGSSISRTSGSTGQGAGNTRRCCWPPERLRAERGAGRSPHPITPPGGGSARPGGDEIPILHAIDPHNP